LIIRFDKKYMFDDPEYAERIQYIRYWQKKLKSNDSIKFPDSLVKEVAEITDKFSFAYLKEALSVFSVYSVELLVLIPRNSVSTLFMLANQEEGDHFEFQSLLKTNIRKLKKAIDDGKPEELKPATARARPEPQYLPMPPENVVREQLAKMQAQREARDLNSIALAAARLGRRFVY
jgi:transitional endoplasmic reticulum ATPase